MSTIELTYKQVEEIIRQELKEVILYRNIDEGGDDITDYEEIEHFLHTLSYFSVPQDFKQWCKENNIDSNKYMGYAR